MRRSTVASKGAGSTVTKPTRRERINAAVDALVARGVQPSSRAVLAEMDGRGFAPSEFPNGMSGADLRVFERAMWRHGYRRVETSRYEGARPRWTR